MTRETLLWLVFGGFFVAPVMVAMAVGWMQRQWQLRRAVAGRRHWPRRPPTTREELRCMAEYQRRRRRMASRLWAAVLGGLATIFVFDLPLTGIALATLLPLLAAVEHLRCPACDTTPTLRGLTDGHRCRRCGTKIKA